MAKTRVPYTHSIVLATQNVRYNLATLLLALASPPPTVASGVLRAEMVQLQSDINNGGGRIYIGDPDTVASTDCGVVMVATQALTIQSVGSNLLVLSDIGLVADTDNMQVNVVLVTR